MDERKCASKRQQQLPTKSDDFPFWFSRNHLYVYLGKMHYLSPIVWLSVFIMSRKLGELIQNFYCDGYHSAFTVKKLLPHCQTHGTKRRRYRRLCAEIVLQQLATSMTSVTMFDETNINFYRQSDTNHWNTRRHTIHPSLINRAM